MEKEVQIELSPEEVRQFTQAVQNMQNIVDTLSRTTATYQPGGPVVTIDDRCQYRWPLATPENRRRIRDVFVARYRQQLGREPRKLTGDINATFVVEEEHLPILDRAIDVVRNELEAREKMPLFDQRAR